MRATGTVYWASPRPALLTPSPSQSPSASASPSHTPMLPLCRRSLRISLSFPIHAARFDSCEDANAASTSPSLRRAPKALALAFALGCLSLSSLVTPAPAHALSSENLVYLEAWRAVDRYVVAGESMRIPHGLYEAPRGSTTI